MTKRECRKVAKKIAQYELILQNSDDKDEKYKAQGKINELCELCTNMYEMMFIDEEVQKILQSS